MTEPVFLFPTDTVRLWEPTVSHFRRQPSLTEEVREIVRAGLATAFPDLILPPPRPLPPDPTVRLLAELRVGLQVLDPRALVRIDTV